MRFLLLRDEESVAEIAGKAFKNLSAEDLIKAEDALLKANPELKSIAKLRSGTLIRIPVSADTAKPNKRNLVDPIEDMIGNVIKQLKALEAEIKKSHTTHKQQQKEYSASLKAARRDLKDHPEGKAVTNRLKKHLRDSKKINKKNKEMGLDALKKLLKSAATIDG